MKQLNLEGRSSNKDINFLKHGYQPILIDVYKQWNVKLLIPMKISDVVTNFHGHCGINKICERSYQLLCNRYP